MGSACAKQDKGSVQELPKVSKNKNKGKDIDAGGPRPIDTKK